MDSVYEKSAMRKIYCGDYDRISAFCSYGLGMQPRMARR